MRWQNIQNWIRVVSIVFEITFRQNVADAFILFGVLIQPLIIAILALWMLREREGNYAIFVVVGSGMTGLWTSVLFTSGDSLVTERRLGTLEVLVGTPTPIQFIIFGKCLAIVFQSLTSMIVSYSLVSFLFGYPLQVAQPALFAISLAFTVISFVCFGLILALIVIITPETKPFQNCLEFPIYILSGFLFPIALLPDWITPLSYLLTPYWAARALHGTAAGSTSPAEVMFSWGMILMFSLIYLLVSRKLFNLMLHKTRVDATLGMQ